MTTSNGSPVLPEAPAREPLRLALSEHHDPGRLDGGWWPQSRDLATEMRDLVENFPVARGRVVRALVSPPDWDPAARRIPVTGGSVKVGSFPRDDTHLVVLTTSDRTVLQVLVVPADLPTAQAEEAMLAATTRGNAHSAADLLAEVAAQPASVAADHWTDGPA